MVPISSPPRGRGKRGPLPGCATTRASTTSPGPPDAYWCRDSSMTAGTVSYSSTTGRGVILAAVLGSGMVMLDGTVVNVALRTIGTDLDASLSELQWISNAYLLALASLILLGGALGDRLGRRRVFVTGVVAFAAASVICGLAPDPGTLIAARALQGVGGALLTPGSLAIIEAVFDHEDRGRAIGAWTGLGSIAA